MRKVKQTAGRRLRRCCDTKQINEKHRFRDRPRTVLVSSWRPTIQGPAEPCLGTWRSHMRLSIADSLPTAVPKSFSLSPSLRLYPWPFPGLVAKPASLAQHNCNTYTTRPFPMPHPRWECDPEPEALTQLTASQAQAVQMLRVQRKRRQWLQFKLHNFQHTPIHRGASNVGNHHRPNNASIMQVNAFCATGTQATSHRRRRIHAADRAAKLPATRGT